MSMNDLIEAFNLIEKNKTSSGASEKIGNESASKEINRENLSKLLFFLAPAKIPKLIPRMADRVTERAAKMIVGFMRSFNRTRTSFAPKIVFPMSPLSNPFR